jgi:tripartite-type tricarboxylate transporter receptor subunit TctC
MEKTYMKTGLRFVFAGILSFTLPTLAMAEGWPTKPLTVVVPYGPGGGVDVFTRPIAAKLSENLGQPVVVENRPGAGGIIGVRHAANSSADGYTLLSGGVHQPMAEGLYPDREYDLDKDFVPIALTASVPTVLVVTNKAPFKSVKELISYAKKHPGEVNYCSSGNGTSQHIVGESFKRLTGIDITHVPYRGTAAAMVDLIAGYCSLMFDGMGTSAPQIRGGKSALWLLLHKNAALCFQTFLPSRRLEDPTWTRRYGMDGGPGVARLKQSLSSCPKAYMPHCRPLL